jgi:hypothetical protein
MVTAYLEDAGSQSRLQRWQFRQLVHALQLFFTGVARSAWVTQFDWQYWLESPKELAATHPTVARQPSLHSPRDTTSRV